MIGLVLAGPIVGTAIVMVGMAAIATAPVVVINNSPLSLLAGLVFVIVVVVSIVVMRRVARTASGE